MRRGRGVDGTWGGGGVRCGRRVDGACSGVRGNEGGGGGVRSGVLSNEGGGVRCGSMCGVEEVALQALLFISALLASNRVWHTALPILPTCSLFPQLGRRLA
jgi:hypothetical protein